MGGCLGIARLDGRRWLRSRERGRGAADALMEPVTTDLSPDLTPTAAHHEYTPVLRGRESLRHWFS